MRIVWLRRHRLPIAVLAATLVLSIYLALATTQGTIPAKTMMGAIFRYGLAPGMAATYALRASLVWLSVFSVLWSAILLSGE